MDTAVVIASVVAGFAGAGCFLWLGIRLASIHILEEVARQGFFNLNGVRYRVDRIGRRPSENSR
jgi:hypothetical protein